MYKFIRVNLYGQFFLDSNCLDAPDSCTTKSVVLLKSNDISQLYVPKINLPQSH